MAREKFREVHLSRKNIERLHLINGIIREYQEQGYVLTLRQLYYQLVSRDIIPNKQAEYAKLSILLKEGRMGGIVDWTAIEDRLRKPSKPSSWKTPQALLRAAIDQYEKPRMAGQPNYIEVWVEKDALSGVLKRVTEKYHIPIMVNRGYSSVSAMFDSHKRFVANTIEEERPVVILYLGDFDPSGLDMIRDITDRIQEFKDGADGLWAQEYDFTVRHIALTESQIRMFNPPPNPAKVTDPRAKDYIARYGRTSWEVDALKPEVLHQLLESYIDEYINIELYDEVVDSEDEDKDKLRSLMEKL